MEAKSGTSENGQYTRRAADGASIVAQRNLHWGAQATDISLLPQSPLSIQAALNQPGSRICLLPLEGQLTASKPDTRNEPPGGHLRTRYSEQTLREKCRQLVIESALAKSKHEKHLYIAVGFLGRAPANEDKALDSALLFYPVRLITEDIDDAAGVEHLLLNEDGVPEFNYHLQEAFKDQTGIEFPPFNPRQSLAHFFSQVEHAIRQSDTASLDISMRLGIAAAPAGINPQHRPGNPTLQKIPPQFRFSLARRLIENLELGDLQTTLRLLDASNDFKFSKARSNENAAPDIARVREFSMLLSQYGLGHVDFQLLPDLPDRINNWIADTEPVLGTELFRECMSEHEITAVQLMKLAGIVELIDKAPEHMNTLLHRDLAYRGTHLLFKRAKHQAQLIHDELAQLQRHFHLDRIPAKGQLLQLIEELGGTQDRATDHGIDVVDSDYFNARRQFMDFSTDKPTTLSVEHRKLLAKLVKVLRFRELFVNNTEYRLALGPAYRGLKTDWDRLAQVLDYAQELRQVLGSAAIAASAIENWQAFRVAYTRSLPKLLTANTAVRGLLKIIRSTDQTTSTTELLIKAKFLSDQLRSWNMDYGLIKNFQDKSANSLLHLFSGKAGIDARTEDLVRDANNRIQDFLLDNQEKVALQQINETISWLNGAVNTESISMDEIVRVMELAEENYTRHSGWPV